jgi:RNA polymerase sigma factor (sigma-70 family)
VDDRLLVELLLDGDPRGLAGVYDMYADRLYAYCTTMLRDRDGAADAVHDTLLVARERVSQLRDPDRLRPWLYAIARNECLRIMRDRRRTTLLDEAGDVTDDAADLDAGLRAGEMRELVWAAAESLNPAEREVLELTVRHGLEGADLAAALGVSPNHASALASRARTQLERALSVLVVARTGRQDCAELDGLLGDWDGRLTPLLRKRIGRHLERCDICGEQRRRRVSAAALLAGVPFLIAPPQLRERIVRDASNMELVAYVQGLATRAGPYQADGFPQPLKRPGPGAAGAGIAGLGAGLRGRLGWAAAAVAVLLLLVLGGVTLLPKSAPKPQPAAGETAAPGPTEPAPISTDGATTPPESTVDTTAAVTTPPPTTTAAVTTTPDAPLTLAPPPVVSTVPPPPTTTRASTAPTTRPPVRTTTKPPPPPPPPARLLASSTTDDSNCNGEVGSWAANLTATLTNGTTKTVTAVWTDPNGGTQRRTMQQTSARVWTLSETFSRSDPDLNWTAITTTDDGQQPQDSDTAANPCPNDVPR